MDANALQRRARRHLVERLELTIQLAGGQTPSRAILASVAFTAVNRVDIQVGFSEQFRFAAGASHRDECLVNCHETPVDVFDVEVNFGCKIDQW